MQFPSIDQVWPLRAPITPWRDICQPWSPVGLSVGAVSAVAWTTANQARFIPFLVSRPVTVTQIHLFNGDIIAGNVDVGIYDMSGNRLVSGGGAAHSGATTVQTFNTTDTLLIPGRYYAAMASNSTTAEFQSWLAVDFGGVGTDVDNLIIMGLKSVATAYVLPATVTLANYDANIVPLIVLEMAP